jgi:hypothetical protein
MKSAFRCAFRAGIAVATLAAGLSFAGTARAMVTYSGQSVSGITQTGVTSLNTYLDSTSSLTHTATFDYGPTSSYGTIIAGTTGANNVTPFLHGNVSSVPITGLTCGTTYHWSVVVAGTYDNDQTFTTSACPAPAITVGPSSKAYGTVLVGASSQQTFTISNTGNADLVVSGVTLGGAGAAMFGVSLGTCASLTPTITAGNNCTVTVGYSPSASGASSASFTVASNAGATVNVALTGTGLPPGGNVPTLSEWGTIFLAAGFAMVLLVQARNGVRGSQA